MEAIIATVISVLAVLGLAYSFGLGRGFINRYEAARGADALASACMDSLGTAGADLHLGGPRPSPPIPVDYHGLTIGSASWVVSAPAGGTPGANKLVEVVVTARWSLAGVADSVQYTRLFPAP